jgi:hypothetical protein
LAFIGNNHPTSAIKHGVSGFLSDNPNELCKYAMMLVEDKKLAELRGQQARKVAVENFSLARFEQAFRQSIETARQKWAALQLHSPDNDFRGQAGQVFCGQKKP